jgi:rfaE bifunctional protein kinase chain/domain
MHDPTAPDGAVPLASPRVTTGIAAALAVHAHNGSSPRRRLLGILARCARARVLVVGDMVADEYIIGAPTRISREAPVLILEQREQFTVPGGATNPGVNARALGAQVLLAGVIGEDLAGQRVRAALEERGVQLDGLFSEPDRPTTTKTRILAGSSQLVQQQIVRVDRVDRSPPSAACERQLVAYLQQAIPHVDALIVSDYETGAGVITPAIIDACLPLARALGKVVVADSHGDLVRFQGATALTPNEPEAAASLGIAITDNDSLENAGRLLLERTQAQGVLITRGSEGMSLFERGRPALHLPASNLTEVFDATGAGDTVSATFTLALVAGASMAEAAALATIAAGLVVRRLGCATTSPAEMRTAINALVGA